MHRNVVFPVVAEVDHRSVGPRIMIFRNVPNLEDLPRRGVEARRPLDSLGSSLSDQQRLATEWRFGHRPRPFDFRKPKHGLNTSLSSPCIRIGVF